MLDMSSPIHGDGLPRRVTTVAGSRAGWEAGRWYADGKGGVVRFHRPFGVAVDGNNAILVADAYNHPVRNVLRGKGRRL